MLPGTGPPYHGGAGDWQAREGARIFNSIFKDLATLAHAGGKTRRATLRALAELALARVRLALVPARRLPLRQPESPAGAAPLSPAQLALVDRAAYVIPRLARRLPFKSDCLVQALAAHRWLGAAGVPVIIHLGTRKDTAGQFEAHAWTTAPTAPGQPVITGWDIERFPEFTAFPPA